MNQYDLDQLPEMGKFHKEPMPGMPNCYRPVRDPVYVLSDMEIVYDSDGEPWFVGWHDGKKWKARA